MLVFVSFFNNLTLHSIKHGVYFFYFDILGVLMESCVVLHAVDYLPAKFAVGINNFIHF
jgi:hypothetical protein